MIPLAMRLRMSDNVLLKTNNINVKRTDAPSDILFTSAPSLIFLFNYKNRSRSVKPTPFDLILCYLCICVCGRQKKGNHKSQTRKIELIIDSFSAFQAESNPF